MEGKNSGLIDQPTLFSIQGEDHRRDDGWKTVTSDRRRSRKQKSLRIPSEKESSYENNIDDGAEHELKEPHPVDAPVNASGTGGSMSVESDGGDVEVEKYHKRPDITVSDAAANINAANLVAFLVDISKTYDTMQDVQLMRFVDYFSNVFAEVTPSQFPWIKILNESSVSKITDIPLGTIPAQVYKISVDWLSRCSFDALGSFVLLSMDNIICDNLELHQAVGVAEESKKVSMFVVLAMILRCKPDVLVSLWPIFKEDEKFEERNEATLSLMVWAITQALQGDIGVGLFMWVRYLLRMLELDNESNSILPSTHLILQVVERILSSPKARNILVNGAVRKGERLVPPSALELLMRLAFSSPSEEIRKRFEGVYPTLKEVAIAVSHGSKAMKQITHQIMRFALKAAGEGIPDLSREACNLFIWCLTQNPNCFKIWDDIYLQNVEGSAYVLEKLSEDRQWKTSLFINHPTHESFKDTIKNFRMKNEKAMADMDINAHKSHQESLKVSEMNCKKILRQVSYGHDRCTTTTFVIAAIAVGLGVATATATTFFIRLNLRNY